MLEISDLELVSEEVVADAQKLGGGACKTSCSWGGQMVSNTQVTTPLLSFCPVPPVQDLQEIKQWTTPVWMEEEFTRPRLVAEELLAIHGFCKEGQIFQRILAL